MRLIKLTTYIKFIMKRLLLIAVAVLTLFAACDKDEEASSIEIVKGKKVLNGTTVNMNVWDGMEISVRRIPKDSESLLYTWTSSNTNVVSIKPGGPVTDNYCKVTAKNEGEAIITVTADNGLVASYNISVREIKVTGIELKDTTVSFGDTIELNTIYLPDSASFKKCKYKSSNVEVAKIGDDGNVVTVGVGECKITAITEDSVFSAECKLTVKPMELIGSGSASTDHLTILVDESFPLEVKITSKDATKASIKWTSSDETVATINNDGELTGVSAGECTITATSPNTTLSVQWIVKVVE